MLRIKLVLRGKASAAGRVALRHKLRPVATRGGAKLAQQNAIEAYPRQLSVFGKGGTERTVPLHVEAVERLIKWIEVAGISDDSSGPLFRPVASPRGRGRDGFIQSSLTTRSTKYMVKRYARQIALDVAVTVYSLRVTALTTARERGADIIDLQDFAGHADPRTTHTYMRTRDRLSNSPAYVLKY